MTWLRLDAAMRQHPKLLPLTPAQKWVWVDAMLWVAEFTDNTGKLPQVADRAVQGLSRLRPKLRELGLLDVTDDGTDEIHDWLLYTGASLEAKVAYYLDRHPDAPASEVAREIHGNKSRVLQLVTEYRSRQENPCKTGSDNGSESPRARARLSAGMSASRPDPSRSLSTAAAETHRRQAPPPAHAAAAANIDKLLDRVGVQGLLREEAQRIAHTQPARIEACLRAALDRADRNPAGLFRTLLDSGDTPNTPGTPPPPPDPLDTLKARIRNTGHALTRQDVTADIEDLEQKTGRTLPDTDRLALLDLWRTIADPEPTAA